MAQNINQIATAATSILATDKLYLGRSPFGLTDDRYILGSSILSQFAPLTAKGDLYTFSTVNARLAVGTIDGQILQVSAAAATGLAWSTATYPSAVGAAGKIIRSDGTNNLYTTATFADTYAINSLLYASASNAVTALATGNSSVLVTSAGGVPSLSTTLPGGLITTDPVVAQGIATKNYVDTTALNGTSVYAATTVNLSATQAGAGVGATLTDNAGTFLAFSVDGVSPPLNTNILVKNYATAQNEGIYTLTRNGDGVSIPWQLTRATGFDTPIEINNTGLIIVDNGTQAGQAWYNSANILVVDTTPFVFSRFGASFPISLANGGTNASLTASNGGIFWSNATQGQILAGTATAGLALLSGASGTPSWSTSPPITKVVTQIITATGSSTYTPTTGMKFCSVEIVGGGGGTGGIAGAAAQSGAGGGAGGGGYCRKLYTSALLGATATVVIGTGGAGGAAGNNNGTAGGNSTFTPAGAGAILTASGGALSLGSVSTAANTLNGGGAGGTGTNGDVNIAGGAGSQGVVIGGATANSSIPGAGGSSFLSPAAFNAGNQVGSSLNYGGGSSGSQVNGNLNVAGAAGAQGICIITEYISV